MENGMCDPGTLGEIIFSDNYIFLNFLTSKYWLIYFLGYAYEWGACNRSYVDRNTEAVGIVEDNGGYSGLIPATHEVAHLSVDLLFNFLYLHSLKKCKILHKV